MLTSDQDEAIRRALARLRTMRAEDEVVKEPPRTPRVIFPEHELELEDLPRGPKAVAKKAGSGWGLRWTRAVTEELEDPKRGGESVGLSFYSLDDGRHGWAVWLRGSFAGAFLYATPSAIVPEKLSASKLKEVLSG